MSVLTRGCVFVYFMAGIDVEADGDVWEDASDIFEVRSEVGGLDSDEPGTHSDDVESSGDHATSRASSSPARRDRRQMGSEPVQFPAGDRRIPQKRRDRSARDRRRPSRAPGKDRRRQQDPGRNLSPPTSSSYHSLKPEKPPTVRTFIKPPRFEGKEGCLESHLAQFEIVAKRNCWDNYERADFLKCSLTGEATRILRDLSDDASYEDVVVKLRQRYGSIEQLESFRMELKNRRRRPGKTLAHLLKDIRRLFMQAYPGPPSYMSELIACDAFITALNDRELMLKVMEREPSSLDQAFKIAERMELYKQFHGGSESETKSKGAAKVRATVTADDSVLQTILDTQKLMQKQINALSESMKKDKTIPSKVEAAVKGLPVKSKVVCYFCKKSGHYKADCPERLNDPAVTARHDGTAARVVSAVKQSKSKLKKSETVSDVGSFHMPERSQRKDGSTEKQRTIAVGMAANNGASEQSNEKETEASARAEESDIVPKDFLMSREKWLEFMRRVPPPRGKRTNQPDQPVMLGRTSQSNQTSRKNRLGTSDQLNQPNQPNQPIETSRTSQTSHTSRPMHLDQPTSWRNAGVAKKKYLNSRMDEVGISDEEASVCTSGNTYYVEMKLSGKRYPAMLDTGSEVTLLPKRLADLSKVRYSTRKLRAANGTNITLIGEWNTIVEIGNLTVPVHFIVSDQIEEIIIGVDWMKLNRCVLSFSDCSLTLRGYCFPLMKKAASRVNRVILGTQVVDPIGHVNSTRDQESVAFSRILEDHVGCLVGQPRRLLADSGTSVKNNLIDRSVAEVTKTGETQARKQRVNCSDCNQSFRKKSELTRHYQSKPQELKWHCVDCDRIYKSRNNLKRHCRKRHPSVESTGTVGQIEGQSPEFDLPGRVATCTVIPESEESIPELEPEQPDVDNSPVEFVAKQQERFRQAYQITRDRLKVTAQKRKSYYDLGVRAKQFPVGSSVWYFYPRQYLKRSKKWSFVYVGPYKVVKQLSDLTYVIQKSPRDKDLVVHVDKLKLCLSMDDDPGGPRV